MDPLFGLHTGRGWRRRFRAARRTDVVVGNEFRSPCRGGGSHARCRTTAPIGAGASSCAGVQTSSRATSARWRAPCFRGDDDPGRRDDQRFTRHRDDQEPCEPSPRRRSTSSNAHGRDSLDTARAFDWRRRWSSPQLSPTINSRRGNALCARWRGSRRRRARAEFEREWAPKTCYFLGETGLLPDAGNGDGEHRAGGHGEGPCTLHNPNYDFNDDLIPLGAAYWVRLVERWFAAS